MNIENEIILENVGRESETYLHYIITNYNNLPDVVVFTQGRISDHYTGRDDINFLLKLKDEAFQFSKSQNFFTHYDIGINKFWDKNWNVREEGYYLSDNYKNNNPITFIEWYKQNIDIIYPDPINIYEAAIFAVNRELILKNPIEYYERLILEVNHQLNPSEGHFFERVWYYVF